MFDNITSIIGQARAGAVKPLGITTLKRYALAPEYRAGRRHACPATRRCPLTGVGVRAGTPKAICDKIEADTRAICQDPLLRERLAVWSPRRSAPAPPSSPPSSPPSAPNGAS